MLARSGYSIDRCRHRGAGPLVERRGGRPAAGVSQARDRHATSVLGVGISPQGRRARQLGPHLADPRREARVGRTLKWKAGAGSSIGR